MGAEKGGPKSRGFFHIFDWNRKSRKKLFSVSPESTKQDKRTEADLNGIKLVLVDEDEAVGISSIKDSSDYSCASSVTDERNGIREPGVVARLMGLDSIPTSCTSEPYSTPFLDIRSLSHKRSPDFLINDQFNHVRSRIEVHSRKPMEFRCQKLPSSPIERFQIEALPPRSVKAVPQIHHKLMSPIKNPGFISPENAAHIMEAAAKILEPALPVKTKAKVSSSYGPLKVSEPRDKVASYQRTSRVLESGRRTVESSDMKYLKGQSLNRSWNGSEGCSSQDISDTNSLNGMGKGKSVSLAIQAKVNVQKREGLSINRKNASLIAKDADEVKLNQPFKGQQSNHRIKQQKKTSVAGGSSVLRQNNQKQNCLSGKGKVTSKQSVSNHQERKNIYGDASSRKNESSSKLSGNSRFVCREETLDTCTTELDGLLSSNKNFPRKKRLTERGFNSQRNSFVDNIASKPKHVQSDVLIDEQSRWNKHIKNDGADVVSFTFNSPLVKSRPGAPSFIPAEENCDKRNICATDIRKNDLSAKHISSYGLNVITGDALSILLEQKLRELTSGNQSSYCNFIEAASSSSSIPLKQEKLCDIDSGSSNAVGQERQFKPRSSGRDHQSLTYSCGTSSTNGQVFGLTCNLQGLEEAEYSRNSNAWNQADSLQPSPLSILDASLSEGSNSSLNSTSSNGSNMSLRSVQAQNISSSYTENKIFSLEPMLEHSYSSSSSSPSSVRSIFSSENQSNPRKSNNPDLNYVRDILNNRRICTMDSALRPLDPHLFSKLENKKGKDGRIRRKMMFDCVNECLKSKYSQFLRSGYQAWASGEALISEHMAENLYEEISRWEGFGDCMVDELVDRDMSSRRGRWVDFDTEAFELGVEMEMEIFTSLVDEVLTDIFVQV
ncbi:uncharacterized protein LOC110020923 [Phalaenopsis equestris]|uniref:uncharacterized protein LOC110020923 n=1 Tax=Phalaenopsis equestris TaxID=78828 RepID=UPI0009E5E0BB|nr:uncharacterized protein LOC110020923 [Phalaenopsis equestris]XP_020574865.1 uncharacterized protein LOC110020923 [Phalaenopsis equestris]